MASSHCYTIDSVDPVYRSEIMPSGFSVFLILKLSPVLLLRLMPTRLLRRAAKGRLPRIELMTRFRCPLNSRAHGNRLIPSESLAHIYHTTLTVSQSLLQLLALCRHLVNERRTEAIGGLVPLYHDAV